MTSATTPATDREPGWGQSLGHGAAGIALLHIQRAQAGITSWDAVHAWAQAMTRQPIIANSTAGLFRGAPAVAYALHTAAQPAYGAALATLDAHITSLIQHRVERAHSRITAGHLPVLREYDLISGLTGFGVYLLHRGDTSEAANRLLGDILTYLVRLTEPLNHNGHPVPGWWTRNGPDDQPSARWPDGHGNLGLAHGIAGPLALLSICMSNGHAVSGQAAAIARICAWTDQWQSVDPHPWWPSILMLADHRTRRPPAGSPPRPSWCYGVPGQARAQQLAALALHDPERHDRAEAAMTGCLTDERQLGQLTDTTLCHGWTGLLHTVRRIAADARTAQLTDLLPELTIRTQHHVDRHGPPDHPGLLEGACGLQLVTHPDDTTAAALGRRRWDACLLTAASTMKPAPDVG